MILHLPPVADIGRAETLNDLRHAYDVAAQDLAAAELAAAAELIQQAWGADAARLLVDMDSDEAECAPLLLFDHFGKLLWFNATELPVKEADYPGSAELSDESGHPDPEMSAELLNAIGDHICAGYQLAESLPLAGSALVLTGDEDLWSYHYTTLLDLDIPMALGDV